MNLSSDNALMLGIIFLAIGIAFALLAYAAIISRRSNDEAEGEAEGSAEETMVEMDEEAAPAAAAATAEAPAPASVVTGDAEQEALEEAQPEAPKPPAMEQPEEPAPVPVQEPPPAPPLAPVQEPPPAPPTPLEPRPAQSGLRPLVTLLRDETTGKLILQIGDERYRSLEELRRSEHIAGAAFAARQLQEWFEEDTDAVEGSTPPRTLSMVQEINEILDEKANTMGGKLRGVRLMEDASGMIRVFVGLKSYPLDQVPDPDVQQFIRDAVAEWEARR